jgi:hypothetical protein
MTSATRKELLARALWNQRHQGRNSCSRPLTCGFCKAYLAYAAHRIGYAVVDGQAQAWVCPKCGDATPLLFDHVHPAAPGFRMKKTRAQRIAEIADRKKPLFSIRE